MKKEIESITRSLEVKILDQMNESENEKKDQALIHGEMGKKEVILKVVPLKDKSKVYGLEKEVLVDNIIEKHNADCSLPFINRAKVLSTGRGKDYAWIVRQYYKGRALSKIKDGVVLMGYDVLQNKYSLDREEIVNQVVESLQSFRTIKKDFEEINTRRDLLKQRYEENIERYCIKEIEKGLSVDLSKQIDFYAKNNKSYFCEENIHANVGDLVPANIILMDDKKIILSDFEWFCFDNDLMDTTFLWSYLWRYPDWQNDLLHLSVNDEQDKIFFRMSLIRQIIGKYSITFDPRNPKDHKRIQSLKAHIWTKYLVAAGESYEAILKVK